MPLSRDLKAQQLSYESVQLPQQFENAVMPSFLNTSSKLRCSRWLNPSGLKQDRIERLSSTFHPPPGIFGQRADSSHSSKMRMISGCWAAAMPRQRLLEDSGWMFKTSFQCRDVREMDGTSLVLETAYWRIFERRSTLPSTDATVVVFMVVLPSTERWRRLLDTIFFWQRRWRGAFLKTRARKRDLKVRWW